VKTIITLDEALEKIKQLKNTYYFRLAAMDGFAVRHEDVYPLKISGKVYAGDGITKTKIKSCEAIAIFTTGGVSVGERDFVADIIAEAGETVFHRVAIRPGKPCAVGNMNKQIG